MGAREGFIYALQVESWGLVFCSRTPQSNVTQAIATIYAPKSLAERDSSQQESGCKVM